jgi:hypothetical protein
VAPPHPRPRCVDARTAVRRSRKRDTLIGMHVRGGAEAQEREPRYLHGMSALKARVENGRIKLDEPTDLPEGQIIELIPLDEVIATDGDDLDDAERAALHRSIDESIDDEEAGNVEDLSKIIAELRAQL